MNKKRLLSLTLAAVMAAGTASAASARDVARETAQPAAVRTDTQTADTADADLAKRYVESKDVFQIAQLRSNTISPNYRLFKGDKVELLVVGFPDGIGLDGFTVGKDGYVQLPYAGSVRLEGRTLDEAKAVIMEPLGQYIRIPDMSLMITEYGPRRVYVMGEVKNPGIQEMEIDSMNAFAALSSAGGIARRGLSSGVQVMRVEDGIMYYRKLNLKAYTKRHDLTQNVMLEDGDIVYVPRSNGIKWDLDVLPYVSAWSLYKGLTD